MKKTLFILIFLAIISCVYGESAIQKTDSKLDNSKKTVTDKTHLEEYKKDLESIMSSIRHPIQTLRGQDEKKDNAKEYVNSLDNHGKTPLMYAIVCSDIDSLDYMIEIGADLNFVGEDNRTAIFYAIDKCNDAIKSGKYNDKVIAKKILFKLIDTDKTILNYSYSSLDKEYQDFTPLMSICLLSEDDIKYKKDLINKVLDNTTNIDVISQFVSESGKYSITPLAYLCSCNTPNYFEEIKKLAKSADIRKEIQFPDFSGQIFQYLCAEFREECLPIITELLLKSDYEKEFTYKNEKVTPLYCAIRNENLDFIDLILKNIKDKKLASQTLISKDGNTSVVHLVAKKGNIDLYRKLKDAGIINKSKDSNNKVPLDYLKESCKNSVDKLSLTYQLENSDSESIKTAINEIQNIVDDKTSKLGQTTLHVILANRDEKNAIEVLDKLFFDDSVFRHMLNTSDNQDFSVFDYAINYDCKKVVKWFVDKHVAVGKSIYTIIDKIIDSENEEYINILESFLRIEENPALIEKRYKYENEFITSNPIVYLSTKNKIGIQIEIADILLKNGIDINGVVKGNSQTGNSALIFAIKTNNNELAEYLINNNINLLFESKPTTNGKDYGKTALFYALEQRQEKNINLIIRKMDLKLEDKVLRNTNETLLMYFAKYASPQILKAILPYYVQKNKNCMNKKDNEGMTAFLYAVQETESLDVIRLFRIYGSDVFEKNNEKENAIQIAKKRTNDSDSIIRKLEAWGVEND